MSTNNSSKAKLLESTRHTSLTQSIEPVSSRSKVGLGDSAVNKLMCEPVLLVHGHAPIFCFAHDLQIHGLADRDDEISARLEHEFKTLAAVCIHRTGKKWARKKQASFY